MFPSESTTGAVIKRIGVCAAVILKATRMEHRNNKNNKIQNLHKLLILLHHREVLPHHLVLLLHLSHLL